jgi:hypothetical protein
VRAPSPHPFLTPYPTYALPTTPPKSRVYPPSRGHHPSRRDEAHGERSLAPVTFSTFAYSILPGALNYLSQVVRSSTWNMWRRACQRCVSHSAWCSRSGTSWVTDASFAETPQRPFNAPAKPTAGDGPITSSTMSWVVSSLSSVACARAACELAVHLPQPHVMTLGGATVFVSVGPVPVRTEAYTVQPSCRSSMLRVST